MPWVIKNRVWAWLFWKLPVKWEWLRRLGHKKVTLDETRKV